MLKRVEISFGGSVFVCTYCGASGSIPSLARCRDAGPVMFSPLRVGDPVTMYWKQLSGMGTIRTQEPEQFSVLSLSYEEPRHPAADLALLAARNFQPDPRPAPPVHRLMIGLAQSLDGKPYVEGMTGYASTSVSYDELLLWQQGDHAKLAAAGLIHPPKARPEGRWYKRFFGT